MKETDGIEGDRTKKYEDEDGDERGRKEKRKSREVQIQRRGTMENFRY
jgi:hypothetical protein